VARREAAASYQDLAIIAVDASVFFKDATKIFDMIADSITNGKATFALIEGSWKIRFNPISGRDLAQRMVRMLTADAPPTGRITAGGPEDFSFDEFVDAAGDALGVTVSKQTIPRWLARLVLFVARVGASLGLQKALALDRFLTFLWVVGTDESPKSLMVGEPGGCDSVRDLFKELAASHHWSTKYSAKDVSTIDQTRKGVQAPAVLFVFAVLTLILLFWFGHAVPSRDVMAGLTTLLVLTVVVQVPPQRHVSLIATPKFKKLLLILILFEILCLLVIPWSILIMQKFLERP
jgi:hypothetical protein